MLSNLKTKLNTFLNINESEWPRISISWGIGFLFRISFVIGWTVVVSMFLTRVGIDYLPFLFIFNAVFLIIGTVLYSELIHHFSNEILILFTTLLAGIFLFTATFFHQYNDVFFFGSILVGQSLLLGQLGILISIFNEDLFTPLESERTFPIIESAETIGGIIGGTLISIFAKNIPTYKFLYLWVILILLIIPLIFLFWKYLKNIPFLKNTHSENKHQKIKVIIKSYQHIKKIPFLQGLLVVVIIQWVVFNLMEFQYTKAINQKIINRSEISTTEEKLSKNNTPLQSVPSNHNPSKTLGLKTAIPATTHEEDLVYNLGQLNIIIYSAALIVQLIFASRIIKSLGIINSMLIQPILLLLSTIGLTLRFGFTFAAITRTNLEISNVIFKNAYHTSYYCLHQNIREQVKEFLEGFAKPLGAIIGMIGLIILNKIYSEDSFTLWVNIIIFTLLVIVLNIIVLLRKKYTKVSEINSKNPGITQSKLNAIDILSQKGHQDSGLILSELLSSSEEEPVIKAKVLDSLSRIQDERTIPNILDCLDHQNDQVKKSALEALINFKNIGSIFFNHAFSLHRIVNTLKSLFAKESSSEIRELIIKTMANFKQAHIVQFLLDTLSSPIDDHIKVNCIYVCGLFNDPNITYFIKPYLQSNNPKIRACTIAALWQFPYLRKELKPLIIKLLESKDFNELINGVELLGVIKAKKEEGRLIHLLKTVKDPLLELQLAISLGKIESNLAIPLMIKFIFHKDNNLSDKAFKTLHKLGSSLVKEIKNIIQKNISNQINQIFSANKINSLNDLDHQTLKKLQKAYYLAEKELESILIDEIIRKKSID